MTIQLFRTMTARSALLTTALLTGSVAQTAPPSPQVDSQALDRFVAQEMKNYDVPGVSLAIVQQGKIVYVQGYGVRDLVSRRPVNPDTQFAIGSVTKSFTALGMMRLVDRGLIRLDTPVIHYLPEFKLASPEATKAVTIRNLLTHTSGLSRDDAGFSKPNISVAELVALASRTPLVGKPGQVFVYTNANTIIAGAVIQRVTGKSWERFTWDEILKPLGMYQTNFTLAAMRGTGNFSTPNTTDALRGLIATPYYVQGGRAAAGAINSSAADMARYVQYQVGSGAPLLNAQSFAAMHTTFIKTDAANEGPAMNQAVMQLAKQNGTTPAPSPLSGAGYGFYWGTERFQGREVVEHGGNTYGFTANVSLIPSRQSGVVVLVNKEHADSFIEAVRWHVLQALLGTQPPQDTSAMVQRQLRSLGQDREQQRAQAQAARTYLPTIAALKSLSGRYASTTGGPPVEVERSGRRSLLLRASLQGIALKLNLVPIGKNRFVSNNQPLYGTVFSFGQQGRQQNVALASPLGNVVLGQRGVPHP